MDLYAVERKGHRTRTAANVDCPRAIENSSVTANRSNSFEAWERYRTRASFHPPIAGAGAIVPCLQSVTCTISGQYIGHLLTSQLTISRLRLSPLACRISVCFSFSDGTKELCPLQQRKGNLETTEDWTTNMQGLLLPGL